MTRPYKIEGGQKQFFSDPTDKIVQSWLYIESQLKLGVKVILARNLPVGLSKLAEIFNNYRAIGWKVMVSKTFVEFEVQELPVLKASYETDLVNLPEKYLRPLSEHGIIDFDYNGDLETVFVEKSQSDYPNIAIFLRKTGTPGKLRIQHFSNDIQPWWQFVTQIIYKHDFMHVYKL